MTYTRLGLWAILATALTTITVPAQQPGTANKSDQERIIGTWRIAKMQSGGGDQLPDEVAPMFRISFAKDGNAAWRLLDEDIVALKYTISKQGLIELRDGGRIETGLYIFDNDNRLMVVLDDFLNNRSLTLFVLERVGPNEKITEAAKALAQQAAKRIRDAAQRTTSMNNLSMLGRAFHLYHDQFKKLPLHAIYSKDGKTPLLSWRVEMLPYLDEGPLYTEFKRDEPWDSPHNKKLIEKMPKIFEPLGMGTKDKGVTYYQIFTGPGTVFDGTKLAKMPTSFPDGTSQTLLIIEAKDAVIWTKPADLVLPKEKDKMPPVGGLFPEITHVATVDAAVHAFATRKLTPSALRAIVTPAGGEVVDIDKLGK